MSIDISIYSDSIPARATAKVTSLKLTCIGVAFRTVYYINFPFKIGFVCDYFISYVNINSLRANVALTRYFICNFS